MNPVASLKALVASFWKVWSFMRWARGEGARPDQLTDPERRAFMKFAITAVPTLALLGGVRIEDFAKALPGPITKRVEFTGAHGPRIYAGTGNPDGVLVAPRGSMWIDTDSGVWLLNTSGEATWEMVSAKSPAEFEKWPAGRERYTGRNMILDDAHGEPAKFGGYFGFGRSES